MTKLGQGVEVRPHYPKPLKSKSSTGDRYTIKTRTNRSSKKLFHYNFSNSNIGEKQEGKKQEGEKQEGENKEGGKGEGEKR